MPKDRLAELQAKSAEMEAAKKKGKSSNGTPLLSSSDQLEEYLKRVTEMDNRIKKMKEDIEELKKLQKNIISSPLVDRKQVQRLEQISDQVFTKSSALQKEIADVRSEVNMQHMEQTHERMIHTHLTRLASEISGTLDSLRAAQVEYIEKTQKLHHKKVEIVTGKEANEATAVDPKNIQAVFAADFLMEAQKAREELREVETRDAEIKKIENSVVEVNRLFKEINQLVMAQGETIDNIERHVEEAVVKVDQGNSQLNEAVLNQSKARKKVCIGGICIAVVVIAVVIIVIVLVGSSGN